MERLRFLKMKELTMRPFEPDYRNMESAARRVRPARMPIYDHAIDTGIMESIVGKPIAGLLERGGEDAVQGVRNMAEFFIKMGYDCMCFECCITNMLPGGGCLGNEQHEPAIKTMEDFLAYPWDGIADKFIERNAPMYDALAEALPGGLGVVGGVGNGILECVQDLTGYVNLCLIRYDDPELYAALYERATQLIYDVWERFLPRWGSLVTLARIGDDMGFKSSTLFPPDDLISHVAAGYGRIVRLIHSFGKPFLLHSCGNIFPVMESLIAAGIDAKHSNEDAIAPLAKWLELYGDRIAIFGGIDVDIAARGTLAEVRAETERLILAGSKYPGFAFGTGNSIPAYIPVDNYVTMVETARRMRGE